MNLLGRIWCELWHRADHKHMENTPRFKQWWCRECHRIWFEPQRGGTQDENMDLVNDMGGMDSRLWAARSVLTYRLRNRTAR